MKVIWTEDDVKLGQIVYWRHQPGTRYIISYLGWMSCDTPRYTIVSLSDGMIRRADTKQGLVEDLNKMELTPIELLPLEPKT